MNIVEIPVIEHREVIEQTPEEAWFVEKHVNMDRRRSKAGCEDRTQP